MTPEPAQGDQLTIRLDENCEAYMERSILIPYYVRLAGSHPNAFERYAAAREYRKTQFKNYREADRLYREAQREFNAALDEESDEDPQIISCKR